MQYDPDHIGQAATYRLLSGTVIPRPIGWVSSISKDGLPNLAPFSFFNAVGDDPPHVVFSTVRSGNREKDTLRNVLETRQFVVNMVTEELVERMNMTADPLPNGISEFTHAGLTPAPSIKVLPPRVAESPVQFECELVHHYEVENHKSGGAVLLVGRVVMFHVSEGLIDEKFHIDMEKYRPVARLAGSGYSALGNIFSIKRNV
jgi:flavin reductase (DIM6/NTAB) family NADH-FMN oxidoreductase RutF